MKLPVALTMFIVFVTAAGSAYALEWLEDSGNGWVKVRHLDEMTGYMRATEGWGD